MNKKRILVFALSIVLILALCACGSSNELNTGKTFNQEVNTLENVTLTMQYASRTSGIAIVFNGSDEELRSGSESSILIQSNDNGTWKEIKRLINVDESTDSILYAPGNTTYLQLNWEKIYGELPNGEYRAVLALNNGTYLADEFKIVSLSSEDGAVTEVSIEEPVDAPVDAVSSAAPVVQEVSSEEATEETVDETVKETAAESAEEPAN